ncbi:LOW QUALITY PROTEIN: hypothetical protein U9M48_019444 [Paspalum notatum var. saurae]|uniref:Reverse transcriptase Ty1/copia-type domain-containing protein n=1 Tax=Paspalum notatum var. saurae TaxID=547442 RepID=A0AAQ3TF13_PASNO
MDLLSAIRLVSLLVREHGRDYDETFAVAHMTTMFVLFPWPLVHLSLDVKNAFLNGELREEVYMQVFVPEGMVCRLRRSLYGLKRAPRAWFQRLRPWSRSAGFFASVHPALFVHTSSRGRTLLLLYVDDMIITGDDPRFLLHPEFISSREKYIRVFLIVLLLPIEETPMELNLHPLATDGELLDDPTRYRHIVGSLVYLGVTRPDISYGARLGSTIVIFFVSYVIFVGLCHAVYSFHALAIDATWASDSLDRRSLSRLLCFSWWFPYCLED